tara:strand:+ start:16605 stop:17135 length:531 start_codon:yes stop_codon:yes gene_type:complete
MAKKRKYQNSGSSSNAGSRSGSRSSSRSNASGNTMNFSGANIGSGIMDNSITDNRGSGKRSPFSNYQDGSGFGTSNLPSSAELDAARKRTTSKPGRGGLLQDKPGKGRLKRGPRKGKMQGGGKMKKTIEKMPKPPEPKKQGARFDSKSKGLKRGRKGPISERRAKKLDRRMRRNAL